MTASRLDRIEERLTAIEAATQDFRYVGVWRDGETYQRGNFVTDKGSLFHANRQTTERPGQSDAYTLAVKRGKDGRNGY